MATQNHQNQAKHLEKTLNQKLFVEKHSVFTMFLTQLAGFCWWVRSRLSENTVFSRTKTDPVKKCKAIFQQTVEAKQPILDFFCESTVFSQCF